MKDKRTAIYIRLSDEDNNVDGIIKAESNSVAAQRLLIRDYMQRNNLSAPMEALEYVDDADIIGLNQKTFDLRGFTD